MRLKHANGELTSAQQSASAWRGESGKLRRDRLRVMVERASGLAETKLAEGERSLEAAGVELDWGCGTCP